MSREVMQQALEALDEAVTYVESPSWSPTMADECRKVADALRAALASPRAAPIITYGPPAERAESWPNADLPPDIAAQITRRLPELFEDDAPQQAEPVAWRVRGYSQFRIGSPGPWRYVDGPTRPIINDESTCDIEPLYTSPQQQQAAPGKGVA